MIMMAHSRNFILILKLLRLSISVAVLFILFNRAPNIQLLSLVLFISILFTVWDFLAIIKTMNSSVTGPEKSNEHEHEKENLLLPASNCLSEPFHNAFMRMGVNIEKYQGEIENAMGSLWCPRSFDAQAFTICLNRLLDDAEQNWMDHMLLSPREREILVFLAKDVSYREIGRALYLSQSTVKTHVYHIFQKMNTTNRKDTVHNAYQRGWLHKENI